MGDSAKGKPNKTDAGKEAQILPQEKEKRTETEECGNLLSAMDQQIIFHEDIEDDYDFRVPEDDDFDL